LLITHSVWPGVGALRYGPVWSRWASRRNGLPGLTWRWAPVSPIRSGWAPCSPRCRH